MNYNTIHRVLISLLLAAIGLAGVLVWRLYALKTVPIAEAQIPAGTGLVAVADASEHTPSLSFYRLNDGAEQMLAGSFQFVFEAPGRALVYGIPSTTSTEPDERQQYFIVLEAQQVSVKDISALPGPMRTADADPSGKYVLLSGAANEAAASTDMTFYACVTPLAFYSYDSCKDVVEDLIRPRLKDAFNPAAAYQSAWLEGRAGTLLIVESGEEGRLFTYDVQKSVLTDVTASSTDIMREIANRASREPDVMIRRFGPIAWITAGGHKSGIFASPFSKLTPVTSGIVLEETENELRVLNLGARTRSTVAALPPKEIRHVSWFQRPAL